VVYRGTLVQPTGAPMVTISQIDPIGVSFTLPEEQLAAVLRASGLHHGAAAERKATPATPGTRPAAPASAAGSGTIAVSLPTGERARPGA
jgi:hypothetical protein